MAGVEEAAYHRDTEAQSFRRRSRKADYHSLKGAAGGAEALTLEEADKLGES
jgi:hypothetical protein